MASKKGQGQSIQQSAKDYWLQCIKTWYPELHSQTYFLPPLHFNRVPYSVDNIADELVLVAQMPQYGPSQTSSSAQSTCPVIRSNQSNLYLRPVYDSDVRDDRALERVLHCLRALADNSQPKEEMMVVSHLQFGKYLGEPSYRAAALQPRPPTLPTHFRQQDYGENDFGVLIMHRQYGLFTLEIKSVGANFSQLTMTEEQEDNVVIKKLKEAVQKLNKMEVMLTHLMSDLQEIISIGNILAMPNISAGQLLRAMKRNRSGGKVLCQCLGVHSIDDAVKLCLLSDQLSDKRTPSHVNHIVLNDLGVWWQQVVRVSRPRSLTLTSYEQLVARFCHPATTVDVHCITAPHLSIRIPGEAASETGERTARLVLFPQQVELLNRSPPRVFICGPPGTGKTIALIMQAISWLRCGHDVHVVSTWSGSIAATIVFEHQLQETMRTITARSRVHRHQFYFHWKYEEMETAARCLETLSEGRQLCVIVDEAVNFRKYFTVFCYRLIVQVPGVYLWGASMRHGDRPLCLEEVNLTTPLRSPPVVVREVMEADEIKYEKKVHKYVISDVPVPTDGPAVMQITHRDGQSDHTGEWPYACVECGHQIARVLTKLNVGLTGNSNGSPPLQYRDVLVLCRDYLTDDWVNSNGQVTTKAIGLVQGLRACHVPLRVVKFGDEAAIRDTALGVSDLVTVSHWYCVRGLERKVVVVEKREVDFQERLYGMSCCTSQLVLIDC